MSEPEKLFSGKCAAITGASGGLGRRLAVGLARRGAESVALFARREDELQKTAAQVEAAGARAVVIVGDITRAEDCARFFNEVDSQFGGRLDYFISNAGVSMWARCDELDSPKPLRRLMEVNYLGAAWCAKLSLPMLRRARGMIVNISSIQGRTAIPHHCGYAASKHAMEGFLGALACEENDIQILNVRPSWIGGTDLSQNRVCDSAADSDSNITGDSNKDSGGLDVQMCAEEIFSAMAARRETATLPRRYAFLPLLSLLAPKLLRAAIVRKTARHAAAKSK